ncbi:hypothetical protein [Chryseobacterium jejuense]|uniref:hypothetical protein n=1 Tax=Chryseobacterium jejuense TaxID=445960 RepID=UPI001AEB990B|nr:hypothetical protein [Chryseobacterium jejuense]MBP2617108.1 hypothetical protein [Chryseobacterium jejuense]
MSYDPATEESLKKIIALFTTDGQWVNRYGATEALKITEFWAHSTIDRMTNSSMKDSHAFGRYFPSLYFFSLTSIKP